MIVGAGGLLYLEIEDALVLYASLFKCSEQEAADQLRYRDGLEMALVRPLAYDVALQAAVLAHGIAEHQPIVEGNKRIATLVMVRFLRKTITGSARRRPSSPTGFCASVRA